jgi:hypothetical protein
LGIGGGGVGADEVIGGLFFFVVFIGGWFELEGEAGFGSWRGNQGLELWEGDLERGKVWSFELEILR